MEPSVKLVVLGNPQSKRVTLLTAAAQRVGIEDITIVSYRDYFAAPEKLWQRLKPGVVLRIEAPSDDWFTTQQLLRLGIDARLQESSSAIPCQEIERLRDCRGQIVAPRQWYLGFMKVMRDLQWLLDENSQVRWMAYPNDFSVLFDKRQCQRLWQVSGVPVPPNWCGLRCYDQLRDLQGSRWMVKLAHGFSAMGAMAVHRVGGRVRALTTIELETKRGTTRMFVSKRLRVIQDERVIASLFDNLAEEGIIVEQWLPKARVDGRSFDVRVLTIAGRPRHVVGRASSSPFTNLNLDSQRVDSNRLRERLGKHWTTMLRTATRAAASFPKSHYLGLDVLVSPSRDRSVLLEANMWGDYLPGLLHQGQDTYEAELRALFINHQREACRFDAEESQPAATKEAATCTAS